MYKAVVIGGGPAGLSAAIHLARANLEPLVIKGFEPSKYLITTMEVDSYPGFPAGVDGPTLLDNMAKQAEQFGARIRIGNVQRVDLSKRPYAIDIQGYGTVEAESVVIATGASFKLLGIPGEEANFGRGVSICATCSGYFSTGKKAIVVGGGDSALEEAIYLTRYASEVTIVHRRNELRASKGMQERARQYGKIKWALNRTPIEVLADEHGVTGLKVMNHETGSEEVIEGRRLYVAIGTRPNTGFLEGQLPTNERGYLLVKPGTTETGIPGVFACGDVQDPRYGQITSAIGSGCMAAVDCERYLDSLVVEEAVAL
ncbi:NAD(P)/FAD-dependent oxidoreductase [Cohnella thermotolerans]|uniref:NAD(P)/FAD-dependent oxidoreductase n=1 Tax=Cohnella thermotolerans TaxID=329858 RepID=UPI00040871A3|nr:FAD-dependent oxidoreductase [Cohnella thermotolerans]